MPSLRHSSATLCSPRSPSSTMRIFSSAEYCLRVARRMSRTIRSDDNLAGPDSGSSPLLDGYDEPEILLSSNCVEAPKDEAGVRSMNSWIQKHLLRFTIGPSERNRGFARTPHTDRHVSI